LDYLGDRGFIILASLDMFGGISAGMTMEGSIFVEKGGETGVIERHRKTPRTFAEVSSEPPLPAIDRENTETVHKEKQNLFFARRSVEAILEDIKEGLEKDNTVADEAKKDLFSDLATLKIQMGRSVKNRQIIDVVLSNLSNIPSIVSLVTALKSIIEAYLR
jgi:hypothetical protein